MEYERIFNKCPIDSLKKEYAELSRYLTDLKKAYKDVEAVSDDIEEEYFGQKIFGDREDENIIVVENALSIIDDMAENVEEEIAKIKEERKRISKCIEEYSIALQEDFTQCKIDEREDCDEIEELLKELDEMRR